MGVLAVFCFLTSMGVFLAFKQYHLYTFMYDTSNILTDDFKNHKLVISGARVLIQIWLQLFFRGHDESMK